MLVGWSGSGGRLLGLSHQDEAGETPAIGRKAPRRVLRGVGTILNLNLLALLHSHCGNGNHAVREIRIRSSADREIDHVGIRSGRRLMRN
jgi:hypothetical protein